MGKVKIMSFNIGGAEITANKLKDWGTRKKHCMAILKKNNVDIVGFQEVQEDNKLVLNSVLSNYESEYGFKSVSTRKSGAYFNPIYWKTSTFKKLGSGTFYLSTTQNMWSRGWDAKDVRSVTWVRLMYLKTKDTFTFLNLHLDHRGIEARLESSRLITKKLESIQKQFNDTLFVFGDFNERAWLPKNELVGEYPHPILPEYIPLQDSVYKHFSGKGYKDSYIMSGRTNRLDMNTYHDYFGVKFPPTAMRIDWILFKEGVNKKYKVENFRIIKSRFKFPSDHFPVVAEISLEKLA